MDKKEEGAEEMLFLQMPSTLVGNGKINLDFKGVYVNGHCELHLTRVVNCILLVKI
jgi:hypothetical protein